ncbi:MAG TPA: GWxTD domain-containing protein [Bacteroidales bacterium]|nr:GWxTD domain-containing protein [Bacteroidales bacterium]
MKKYLFLLKFLLLSVLANSQSPRAYLSYATFYSPVDGPYIETYLAVDGKTVKWVKNINNKYKATLQILTLFKKDSMILNYKKYNLTSPEIDDTTNINFNFIDQQRFAISDGIYDFEMSLYDTNVENPKKIKYSTELEIIKYDVDVHVSDIELVESYSKAIGEDNIINKSGYSIIPYIYSYYPQEVSKIKYYCEIYNTLDIFGKDYKYLIITYLKSFESNLILNDFYSVRKETSSKVNVVLSEMDISFLPTGNYYLVIEVRDQNNNVRAYNEVFFQRDNPLVFYSLSPNSLSNINISGTFVENIINIDDLKEYIKSLSPISSESEKRYAENILKDNNLLDMQRYFLNFWLTRNNTNPAAEWNNYKNMVIAVNKEFGTRIKKGYETDRGRIYLKYGPPNSRQAVTHEPNAYPYEIWHYYSLNNKQRNKKFVFYNTDLVSGDYELLHSDAIGEINDPLWQRKINRDNTLYNFDETQFNSHWGSKIKDYYDNPR